MDKRWDLEGFRVSATYMDEFPVTGVVYLSRVKYGGGISHHITLDKPIMVYGNTRDSVIVNHETIYRIEDSREDAWFSE